MNMFLHELKANRKSTITWSCSLVLVTVFFLSFSSTFQESAGQLKEIFEGFPPIFLKAMGINPELMTSFVGYYAFMFLYIMLCGAIQAMNLGTAAVSKEATRKTADFILTKPVSRQQILTAKLLSVLTSLLLTDLVFIASAWIMERIVNKGQSYTKEFILISLTVLFLQIIFMAIGFLVSVIAKKIKSVIAVSMATVFGFFIVKMVGDALDVEKVRYISPFNYFDTSYIIWHGSYESEFIIIGAIFVVLAIAASYFIFIKKDIHAV